jgi:hypothetical protein
VLNSIAKQNKELPFVLLPYVVATLLMLPPPAATTSTEPISGYCTRRCGNISIPYHADWFNLT